MKKPAKPKRSTAAKTSPKNVTGQRNEATSDEFEREGMGIAPKE